MVPITCHRDMQVKKYNEAPWHRLQWLKSNELVALARGKLSWLLEGSTMAEPLCKLGIVLPWGQALTPLGVCRANFKARVCTQTSLWKLHHNHACICQNQTAAKVPSAGNKPIGWTTRGNKKKRASRSPHGQLHCEMIGANLKKTTYCTVPSLSYWRKCSYRGLAVIARAWTGKAWEGE